LLDGGSETSIISSHLLQRTDITTTKHHGITILGLGARQLQTCERAKLLLQTPNNHHIPIVANVADMDLTVHRDERNPEHRFPSLQPHYSDVTTLDAEDEAVPIDILIGADYIFSILQSDPVVPKEPRGRGFRLLRSPFGLIPTGRIYTPPQPRVVASAALDNQPEVIATYRVGNTVWPWTARPDRQIVHPDQRDIPTKAYMDLDRLLKYHYSLESIDILDDPNNPRTQAEEAFVVHAKNNLKRLDDGTYTLPLLMNPDVGFSPSNYRAVKGHASKVYLDLMKNGKKELYDAAIQKLVDAGVTERHRDDGEDAAIQRKNVFVGASPVYKRDRVRIILNCAAKNGGRSMNDRFMPPPPVVADLFPILLLARKHWYILCQDLAAFFPSLRLPADQHDFANILVKDKTGDFHRYNILRYYFGWNLSPLVCSMVLRIHLFYVTGPYKTLEDALNALNPKEDQLMLFGNRPKKMEGDTELQRMTKDYIASLFVDDSIQSFPSPEELITSFQVIDRLLRSAHYSTTKIFVNDDDVRKRLPAEDLLKDGDGHNPVTTSILGVPYNAQTDTISPAFSYTPDSGWEGPEYRVTKRIVGSAMGSCYDPLGIAGPFVLQVKLLLRNAHEEFAQLLEDKPELRSLSSKKHWNLPLSEDLTRKFQAWLHQAPRLTQLTAPRWIGFQKGHHHMFYLATDASKDVLGCVLYLKVTPPAGAPRLYFVCAKSKVFTNLTVPRAELTAMLLGAKMYDKAAKALELGEISVTAASDSSCALCWLFQDPNGLLTYVHNRCVAIRRYIPPSRWARIPGEKNPADFLTKPLTLDQLINGPEHSKWFSPEVFLEDALEPGALITDNSDDFHLELARKKTPSAKDILACAAITRAKAAQLQKLRLEEEQDRHPVDKLLERNSDLQKLYRILALAMRWPAHRRKGRKHHKKRGLLPETPTDDEINDALLRFVKRSQQIHFKDELKALEKGELVQKTSKIYQLSPFLDTKGLLRSWGRLDLPEDNNFTAHPLLLGKDSEFALRYVTDLHERMDHKGSDQLLYLVRKNFWIINSKNLVQKVVKYCLLCRKRRGQLYHCQLGKLRPETVPEEMGTARPILRLWKSISIDTLGPYTFLDMEGKPRKCHILVIVDMLSRYVRLVMIDNLTARNLFIALQTHSCITRRPDTVICDCFSSFAVIDKFNIKFRNQLRAELKAKLGQNGIALQLLNGDEATTPQGGSVSTKFNTVFSPPYMHQVAVEGVIRTIKRGCADMLLKRTPLRREEFILRLEQAAKFVNMRPLMPTDKTNVHAGTALLSPAMLHHHHCDTVITPALSDLKLKGSSMTTLQDCYRDMLEDRDRFANSFANHYTSQMLKRKVWVRPGRNIKEGDLVLLKPENKLLKRHEWTQARVCKVFPSKRDGVIREVMLVDAEGKKKRRSARSLVMLRTTEELHPAI